MSFFRTVFSILIASFAMSLDAHTYAYDVAVIGAGSSGIAAAKTAARFGRNVVLIQDVDLQHTRMATSSVPINALVHAGIIAATMERSPEFGFLAPVSINPDNVFSYIRQATEQVQHLFNFNHPIDNNIQVIRGFASFHDPHTLQVDEQLITADKIIIATGGKAAIPPVEGLASVPYLTEDTLCSCSALPTSIIIVGEGPLGIELATALHRLGVKVTLITAYGIILPKYDFELVNRLQTLLKAAGIKIKCLTEVKAVTYENGKVTAYCKNNFNATTSYSADTILFALSRSAAAIDEMKIREIGIKCSSSGISVNSKMQTSIPHIYACGNAVGQQHTLNRVSLYQAHIAGHNAARYFWQSDNVADYANVSSYVRAVRPLASIGLTEQEARKMYGKRVRIYRYSYGSLVKAHIEKNVDGMLKCICDANGNLLGAHVLGEAAETIIDAMRIGVNFADRFKDYTPELRTCPAYPDLAWIAAKRAEIDAPKGILDSLVSYIKRIIPFP